MAAGLGRMRLEVGAKNPSALPSLQSMGWRGTDVHDPTVDVSKLLETEQTRAMSRIIECEALGRSARLGSARVKSTGRASRKLTHGGGINGNRSGIGRRVWFLAARSVRSALAPSSTEVSLTQHEAAEYRNWRAFRESVMLSGGLGF